MPLIKSASKKAQSENIAELRKSGYPEAQAVAISYSEKREAAKDSESARSYDINGFAEIHGNPLSKAGVFPYLGIQISDQLEPNKIYNVYRAEEELNNKETIDSFKLLPFVDDHTMLGASNDGFTPAEKKGVHGVIGEDVYYESPYLKANLKVFSEKLADLIENGKKELSIGYRCLYEIASGVYDGEQYQVKQKSIRGNHLALVDEGRAGPDVAVLDHFKITLDSGSLIMPKAKNGIAEDGEITLKSLAAGLKKCMDALEDMKKEKEKDAEDDGDKPKDFVEKAEVTDEDMDKDDEKKAEDEKEDEEEKKAEDADESEEKEDKEDKKSASMDAQIKSLSRQLKDLKSEGTRVLLREISQRDSLAEKLSQHIGTFDHKDKTLDEVAAYGIKKLGLKCKPGHEDSVLMGYLAASRVSTVVAAQDSKPLSSGFQAYLNGGK